MRREALLRRTVHLSAPVFLLYYLLPSPLWGGGPTRELGLVFVLLMVLIVETLRLSFSLQIPGMRDYERYRISAVAWGAAGMTLAMLLFPLSLSAPAIAGMAYIDPLISKLRGTRWYPWAPLSAHFFLTLSLLLMFLSPSAQVLAAAALASPLAVGSEAIRCHKVDDDFLMVVVPLIGMALVMSF